MDSEYIQVATVSDVKLGEKKLITVNEVPVLIINAGRTLYAVDAFCTHYGGDLSQGKLEGKIITCPNHGSKFDITTGKVISGPTEPLGRPNIENLTVYDLKIEGNSIFIKTEKLDS